MVGSYELPPDWSQWCLYDIDMQESTCRPHLNTSAPTKSHRHSAQIQIFSCCEQKPAQTFKRTDAKCQILHGRMHLLCYDKVAPCQCSHVAPTNRPILSLSGRPRKVVSEGRELKITADQWQVPSGAFFPLQHLTTWATLLVLAHSSIPCFFPSTLPHAPQSAHPHFLPLSLSSVACSASFNSFPVP